MRGVPWGMHRNRITLRLFGHSRLRRIPYRHIRATKHAATAETADATEYAATAETAVATEYAAAARWSNAAEYADAAGQTDAIKHAATAETADATEYAATTGKNATAGAFSGR